MKKVQKQLAAALAATAIQFWSAGAQADTIYDVNLSFAGATVSGTITTDGVTNAFLSSSDITAWSLTIDAPGLGVATTIGSNEPGANYGVYPMGLVAYATGQMALDFDPSNNTAFLFEGPSGTPLFCAQSGGFQCSSEAGGDGLFIYNFNDPAPDNFLDRAYSGYVTIAEAPITPTPAPAALPLFATGLGALGLFGWRRKRKAYCVT